MTDFMNGNGRRGMAYNQYIPNTQINNDHFFPQQNVMNGHAQSLPLYPVAPYMTPPQDQINNSLSFNYPESSQDTLYPSSPYNPNSSPSQGFFPPLNQASPTFGGSLMTPNISSQGQPQFSQDFQIANDLGQGTSGRNGRREGETCPHCGRQLKNLKRHIESMHPETLRNRPERHACNEPGCKRYGKKEFRLDNLITHKRQVHGIYIPRKQRGRARASTTNANARLGTYAG